MQLINVVVPSFLNLGPGPQGVLKVEPILKCKAEDETTPSQPTTKEEEEEKEEEEKEKVVEMLDPRTISRTSTNLNP